MIAAPASRASFTLAEGPVWDDRRERLIWIDIEAGVVLLGSLTDGRVTTETSVAFPATVGAVSLTEDDRLLVAAHDELLLVGADGGRVSAGAQFDGAVRRFNDGQVDSAGRYLVGTLSLEGPSSDQQLFRVDAHGMDVIDADLTLSNGLAWSIDGSRFFSVDTLAHTIRVRDYDDSSSRLGDWSPFAVLEHGYPDGICIDSEDHLWVAVWGEGAVLRLSPDGDVVDRIDVDAPHTTSVAFAGPGLDVLVITTARDGLTEQQLDEFPLSGCLFTARPGVRGLPAKRVSASVLERHFPTVT